MRTSFKGDRLLYLVVWGSPMCPAQLRRRLVAAALVLFSVAALPATSTCRLINAAGDGRLTAVQRLVDQGVNVNGADCETILGVTPLWSAVASNQVGIVKLLLSEGANPYPYRFDLINGAASVGELEIVRALMSYGVDPNRIDPMSGGTALHGVATCGTLPNAGRKCDEIVTALLEGGARPNEPNLAGNAPLYGAAFFGNTSVIRALVRGGADINGENPYGETPLSVAIVQYAYRAGPGAPRQQLGSPFVLVITRLLEFGANPDFVFRGRSEDDEARRVFPVTAGNTPLTVAARYGWTDMATVFLKAGADPTKRRDDDQSPSTIARNHGHLALARLIDRFTSQRPVR